MVTEIRNWLQVMGLVWRTVNWNGSERMALRWAVSANRRRTL